MARHERPLNRDDYVTRWARILNIPFPDAWDMTAEFDDEVLRDAVDQAEAMIRDTEAANGVPAGAYDEWLRGQTTTVRGVTR